MLCFYYKISNCFGYTYACSFLEQITNRKVPCILGAESKVPVGILEVRLELIPKINDLVGEEVISAQISLEKNRQAEKERLFLVYAKQWWKEYLQIRPHHKDRLVKIFAQVFFILRNCRLKERWTLFLSLISYYLTRRHESYLVH